MIGSHRGEKETARKTEERRLTLKQRQKLRKKMRKTQRDRGPAQRTEKEKDKKRKRLEDSELSLIHISEPTRPSP